MIEGDPDAQRAGRDHERESARREHLPIPSCARARTRDSDSAGEYPSPLDAMVMVGPGRGSSANFRVWLTIT
jgi:hypothetical protein